MAANKGCASVSELKEHQIVGRHGGIYLYVVAALTFLCCFPPPALAGLAALIASFTPVCQRLLTLQYAPCRPPHQST